MPRIDHIACTVSSHHSLSSLVTSEIESEQLGFLSLGVDRE